MTKEEKIIFLRNPNEFLEQRIKNFVKESELNRRDRLDEGCYWEEPLVGFAPGNHPLFLQYKTVIGPYHLTPGEIVSAALREKGRDPLPEEGEQISVISWVLPIPEDTRKDNRKETHFPSKRWTFTRCFGGAFNNALRRHLIAFLEETGHLAVAPIFHSGFRFFRDENVGWTSTWSERHVAYACGLGTFSLNDALITPRGIAVGMGSLVTVLKLRPSENRYRHYRENCLVFRNERCGKCISRCPAKAITEKGHDKDRCREYINSEGLSKKRSEYGLEGSPPSCGLCQTGVPCEFRIPRPDQIA